MKQINIDQAPSIPPKAVVGITVDIEGYPQRFEYADGTTVDLDWRGGHLRGVKTGPS